ncbi:Ig-like domain-containing protein, partial [Ignatzschineria sp. LJL83]
SKAGFDDIGFRLGANEGANGQRERVTYIAGEADITKTRFTANPSSIVANNVTTATLKVELFDALGNRVDSVSADNVEIIFSNQAEAFGEIEQLPRSADGSFTARVKSQVAGVDTFDFRLNTQQANYEGVTVTYTAGTANARMSEISADPVTITADGQTQSTITVQLRDEFGNAL